MRIRITFLCAILAGVLLYGFWPKEVLLTPQEPPRVNTAELYEHGFGGVTPPIASHLAVQVMVDLTGMFLGGPFLPPRSTEPLPACAYETMQLLSCPQYPATYTLFIDRAGLRFWVLKTEGTPAMSEFYGPAEISKDGEYHPQ